MNCGLNIGGSLTQNQKKKEQVRLDAASELRCNSHLSQPIPAALYTDFSLSPCLVCRDQSPTRGYLCERSSTELRLAARCEVWSQMSATLEILAHWMRVSVCGVGRRVGVHFSVAPPISTLIE